MEAVGLLGAAAMELVAPLAKAAGSRIKKKQGKARLMVPVTVNGKMLRAAALGDSDGYVYWRSEMAKDEHARKGFGE